MVSVQFRLITVRMNSKYSRKTKTSKGVTTSPEKSGQKKETKIVSTILPSENQNNQDMDNGADVDEKETVEDLTDDTLSLNLEEDENDEKEKTVEEDSGVECQTSRSSMSASPLEPLLTRTGTYVLTSSTLKDRAPTVTVREDNLVAPSAQSSNLSEEVYFERLDMRLDSDGAADLLNEYYDELHDTVSNMKDLQKNYEKLNNLNKCNMTMLRREMTDWAEYYKLQLDQTNLLAATREAELNDAKDRLKKTLDENKQLKETNSKLEMAISNERMKLKKYIQQNIKDRIKQMTTSSLTIAEETSDAKCKETPNETFLKNKTGKECPSYTTKFARKTEKVTSSRETKQAKNGSRLPESNSECKPAEQKTAPPAHLHPNKKPKVFLAHSQAWGSSMSLTPEKVSKYPLKNRNTEVIRHYSYPAAKQVPSHSSQGEKKVELKPPTASDTPGATATKNRSTRFKVLKAKEYEDIMLPAPKSGRQIGDDTQSMDESLKCSSQKNMMGKNQLPSKIRCTKGNKN